MEILEVIGIFILCFSGLGLGLLIIVKGLEPHKPMTEYEIYGEEGACGYEQRMMGMTDEEYSKFNKKYKTNK